MNFPRKQRGMSIWGLLFLAIVIGFFGIVGLKLFPVYLESWKIDKAMTRVVNDTSLVDQDKGAIVYALVKQLDIDGVYRITERNAMEYLTVTKKNRRLTLDVYYEVETPLVGNLSLVAEFDKTKSTN